MGGKGWKEGGEGDWGVAIWGGVEICGRMERRALMGVFDGLGLECPDEGIYTSVSSIVEGMSLFR